MKELREQFYKYQDRIDSPEVHHYEQESISIQAVRKHLVCKDGFQFSCQASETHYCSPKQNGLPAKKYKTWELGAVSYNDTLIEEYDEFYGLNGRHYSIEITVYPQVPTKVVLKLIKKHEGLV
jgi:hypothetical protein